MNQISFRGTVINGQIQSPEPIELPNQTKVSVTLYPEVPSLQELLDGIPEDAVFEEVDFGRPVGKEVF